VGSGVSAHALLTEKFGEVRIPRKSGLDPAPVTGGPQNILQEGDSGLLDVVLDPAFETNQTVFITFNEGTKEQNHLAVFRAKFDGATLSGGKVIFRNSPEKAGPQQFNEFCRIRLASASPCALVTNDFTSPSAFAIFFAASA
jgi:glucose/arabinose dehydrogenase